MACAQLTYPAIPLRAGLGHYERADLYRRRALIFIPYNISIMSLYEHYAAGAPLYVPSRPFLKELLREWPAAVLSSLSFTQVTGSPAARHGEPDLNDIADGEVVDWYLDRADFYDPEWMPLIRQFGSWAELDELLHADDHAAISAEMLASNEDRFARIDRRYDELGWLDAVTAADG
jgi:hypothetical protein